MRTSGEIAGCSHTACAPKGADHGMEGLALSVERGKGSSGIRKALGLDGIGLHQNVQGHGLGAAVGLGNLDGTDIDGLLNVGAGSGLINADRS